MAAGDILSATILATGWEAEIVVEGFKDGGTYAFGDLDANVSNAKVDFTVVSEGYNTSGTLGTKTRHVYGTRVVQKAYPDQATANEVESGGNVTLTIALSDYIYDDDNTGAGKSGTAPTVTIASGWYTDNGTGGSSAANNVATNLAVTNSSTQDYPKVVGRWAVVPYQVVKDATFDLEMVAFHRFSESGKPVACVTFVTKEGATTKETITATAMVKSAAEDSLPCYRAQLTASSYTDNAVVTCDFTAYPWIGDADSVLASTGTAGLITLGSLPLVMDPDNDYAGDANGPLCAVVSPTGNDGTGVHSTTYATAAANPYATIRGAGAALAGHNGGDGQGCIIYLTEGTHSVIAGSGSCACTDGWLTIQPAPGAAKANVIIAPGSSYYIGVGKPRFYNLTIAPTSSSYIGASSTSHPFWFDHVNMAAASQLAYNYHFHGENGTTYVTHCTASNVPLAFTNNGIYGISPLTRNVVATQAYGPCDSLSYSPGCLLTSSYHHANTANISGGLYKFVRSNSIVAYCKNLANADNSIPGLSGAGAYDHCAAICNVVEWTGATDSSTPNVSLWADGDTSADTNVLMWHNTIAGGRANLGYNDSGAATRSNWSLKFNAIADIATKHDVFATNGAYVGAWSVLHGVGFRGNYVEDDYFRNQYPWRSFGIGSAFGTALGSASYTDDNSASTGEDGTPPSDYTPAAGSPLLNKIPSAADVVIPWDIAGTAYLSGGSAGAYSVGGGGFVPYPISARGARGGHLAVSGGLA